MTVRWSRFENNSIDGTAGVAFVFQESVLTMSDTVMTNNTAINGGAFFVYSSALHLSNCTMIGNHARDSGGAGYSSRSDVTVTSTKFTGNSAPVGGAWSSYKGRLRIVGCTFAANQARWGGALYLQSNSSAAVTSTRFVGNNAVLDGGAISSFTGGNTTLGACIFTGNTVSAAGGSGGALHLGGNNTVTATGTMFEGNNATFGGAIASICSNNLYLLECQLMNNDATALGGALHAADGSVDACQVNNSWSMVTVSLCSFQNNTARAGGGAAFIANGATLNSLSCTFVHNDAKAAQGGGVMLGKNSSCWCSNTSFTGNMALQGGAMAATNAAKARFSGGCVFSSNNASVAGGALMADGAWVMLEDSMLQRNTAQLGGGLMARNGAKVTLGPGVHVVGNVARLFGGGMLVDFECSQQVRSVPGWLVGSL
jgi:hypothetical protein